MCGHCAKCIPCKVFVPPLPRDLVGLKERIIVAVKSIDAPMLTRVGQELGKKKKLIQFSCGCEQFHYGRSFGFLVINVCNHGEHYETPCMYR